MEAIEQLKDDLREGRIDANRLVDLIVALRLQLQASQQRITELESKSPAPERPKSTKRIR